MPPGTTWSARSKRARVVAKRLASIASRPQVAVEERVHRGIGAAVGVAAPVALEGVRGAFDEEQLGRLAGRTQRVVHPHGVAMRDDGVGGAVDEEDGCGG